MNNAQTEESIGRTVHAHARNLGWVVTGEWESLAESQRIAWIDLGYDLWDSLDCLLPH